MESIELLILIKIKKARGGSLEIVPNAFYKGFFS